MSEMDQDDVELDLLDELDVMGRVPITYLNDIEPEPIDHDELLHLLKVQQVHGRQG